MTRAQRITKLLALVKALGIPWPLSPEDTRIDRIRAGVYQRAAGAWSWQLWATPDATARHLQFPSVGSQWTVGELLARGVTGTEVYINPHGMYELIPRSRPTHADPA